MTGCLQRFGRKAVENGFTIVPIMPGSKIPGTLSPNVKLPDWQLSDYSAADIDHLVGTGNGECGIGVLASRFPAVDIDLTDAPMVARVKAFVFDLLGETLERVGNAPKTLLVYKTDAPFKKVTSKKYAQGKIEILGDGQQFVALATHPDTKAPYVWLDGRSIADVEAWELRSLNHDQALAICDAFDRMAAEEGWSPLGLGSRGGLANVENPFICDEPPVRDLSHDELKAMLDNLPNDDDYDTWLNVGMACYHQWQGADIGFDMFCDWSDKSLKHDPSYCEQKWPSFDVEGKGFAPITFKWIIKQSTQAQAEEQKCKYDEAMTALLAANTKDTLADACTLARAVKCSELDRIDFVIAVRKSYAQIMNGETITKNKAGELVRYSPTAMPEKPDWLEGWVYVRADRGFLNMTTGTVVSTEVFNAVHSRLLLTRQERLEGKTKPVNLPSDVAMNTHAIPEVEDRIYLPSEDGPFPLVNGRKMVNTYSDRNVPVAPEKNTASGAAAVERVKRHVRHLIANERDAEIFLSYLAYIVQTRRRPNWAIFLQGAQGDGKTFFAELMAAVLGSDNVNTINGQTLEDNFTGWAEGYLMVFIEEVMLGGENRFKVIDKAKTLVTNNTISVRKMHREAMKVPNTAALFLISNYKNALPVGEEDTRYFPLFSRWQDRDLLVEFKEQNPTYYRDLYASIAEAGAIRKWLLGYRLSPEFSGTDRAPSSSYRAEMVEASADPAADFLKESLRTSSTPDFCRTLLDSALVNERLYEADLAPVVGKTLNALLQRIGMSSLGRVKVGGEVKRFWTAHPEQFRLPDGKTNTAAVRSWFESVL